MSGWQTIVSDAGVFTELVEKLGVKNVQFEELFSMDEASLAAAAPVHAVVFLFKYRRLDRDAAAAGKPLDGNYDFQYQQNNVFFAAQTIQNACATQAVLNALLNKTAAVDVGPELDNIRQFVAQFSPQMAGDTLSNSELIRTVHNSFLAPRLIDADSARPVDEKDDGLYHFITYVHVNGSIYELDGLHEYPIRHTEVPADQFCTALAPILQRRAARYAGEIRFALLAITHDKLKYAQEIGDSESAAIEERRRQDWRRDNNWRRHDYTPLTLELLRGISSSMSDNEWEGLLAKARRSHPQ